MSVGGFIADENDQPGPLFDWLDVRNAVPAQDSLGAFWLISPNAEELCRWNEYLFGSIRALKYAAELRKPVRFSVR